MDRNEDSNNHDTIDEESDEQEAEEVGYEFDDVSQRARVEWDLDNRGREEEEEWSFGSTRSTRGTMVSSDWEQYQQYHQQQQQQQQQQHRPQSHQISNRQQQQPATKSMKGPPAPRTGPYPHAPPANEVLAARRVGYTLNTPS